MNSFQGGSGVLSGGTSLETPVITIEDDLDEVRCLIVHKVNNFLNKESAED